MQSKAKTARSKGNFLPFLRFYDRTPIFFLVLVFTSTTYAQVKLGNDIDGEAAADQSGWYISLSSNGSRVAIGARANDGNGDNAGHVRIYDWNGIAWTPVGGDIDGEAAGDWSGYSVSLSANGSRIAIGAVYNDGNGVDAGQVRIYDWNGIAWTPVGGDIDGEAAGDVFGSSVSLSSDGSRVAIGAFGNDRNGSSSNAGHVRVYDWNGSAWTQVGGDIDGEAASDYSGKSVSLSADGTRLAIGAYLNDGNGNNAGHVRIYDWNGSAWGQVGGDINGEAAEDYSGYSVSLSGDGSRVAIGAYRNDGNGTDAGHVRIYGWNGSAWGQVGSDLDGEDAGDESGYCVSLSGDGNRVAIGAYLNDGVASGDREGQVRIYDWNGNAWVQVGIDIDGEGGYDYSGWFLSLSADGSRVAIGAPNNDGSAPDAGHTRVYSLTAAALPVEWLYFKGQAESGKSLLTWATATEENNAGFHVERSSDGRRYEDIGWVEGVGTSLAVQHYTFRDDAPLAGINYYRLRQVDYDGTSAYAEVITLVHQGTDAKLLLYPNPVTETLTIEQAQGHVVSIYNSLGQLIHQSQPQTSQHTIAAANWPTGVYQVLVQSADGTTVATMQVVK